MSTTKRGIIIGRFHPPHNGHRYLIDFAGSFVDELYIFVCTLSRDSIPGDLRFEWMKELYPNATCIHITEENPNANRNQPDAHKIWADAVRKHFSDGDPDYLFASEEYGWKLAQELGAEFVPVDPNRDQLPVSGTDIRREPLNFWSFLPEVVRPYFIKRIAVVAGKDSQVLTRRLADHFSTLYAPDYAEYYEQVKLTHNQHHTIHESTRKTIEHAQAATEQALSRQANRFLFLSCSQDNEELRDNLHNRNIDHLIVVDSLIDNEQKQVISEFVSEESQAPFSLSFFHWSEHLIANIEKDICEVFSIKTMNKPQ